MGFKKISRYSIFDNSTAKGLHFSSKKYNLGHTKFAFICKKLRKKKVNEIYSYIFIEIDIGDEKAPFSYFDLMRIIRYFPCTETSLQTLFQKSSIFR